MTYVLPPDFRAVLTARAESMRASLEQAYAALDALTPEERSHELRDRMIALICECEFYLALADGWFA